MRISGSSAVPVLLVALLACATAIAGGTASACDGVSCGMGTCKELPPLVPILSNVSTYECDCYPGWAHFVPFVTITACYIPTCASDLSCYLPPTIKVPPPGSNVTTHPCLFMDCGPQGTCVEDKPLKCQCSQGAANLLGNPSFPCTNKNCVIGQDGCPVPSPPLPPPPPPSSMAPPGNDHQSSGPTAPSSTKANPISLVAGYVCLQNLLLLASLAALHIV